VTAGGPFSILQSVGMTWGPVAIPVAGAVVAGAAVTPPDVKERARKWWEELVDKVRGRDEKEEMEETGHDHKAQVVESN